MARSSASRYVSPDLFSWAAAQASLPVAPASAPVPLPVVEAALAGLSDPDDDSLPPFYAEAFDSAGAFLGAEPLRFPSRLRAAAFAAAVGAARWAITPSEPGSAPVESGAV